MLDVGVDKLLVFFNDVYEENFVFGLCGLWVLWVSEDILCEQFMVFVEVDVQIEVDLWVMVFMVVIVEEIVYFIGFVCEYGLCIVGVMVEILVSVLFVDCVFVYVDFVLIGINDFMQYMLVVDCMFGFVVGFQDFWYFVVFCFVCEVGDVGVCLGKLVGICGEVVVDLLFVVVLVGFGVMSFFMVLLVLVDVRQILFVYILDDV